MPVCILVFFSHDISGRHYDHLPVPDCNVDSDGRQHETTTACDNNMKKKTCISPLSVRVFGGVGNKHLKYNLALEGRSVIPAVNTHLVVIT
jgi:hypothetical protein